jgi:hypothetical protein
MMLILLNILRGGYLYIVREIATLIQAMELFATQDALGFCELAWPGSGVLAVGKSVASGLELLGTWFSAVDVFPVPPAAFGASPELALLASRLEISGCS